MTDAVREYREWAMFARELLADNITLMDVLLKADAAIEELVNALKERDFNSHHRAPTRTLAEARGVL